MPKINGITISLGGDREVYRPGDIVSGCWTIDAGESFSVRGVHAALHGAAYTRWRDIDPRKDDHISQERIMSQWCTVYGREIGDNGPNHTLLAGVHQYQFSFKLPLGCLPSSYEGEYGAIRYWIELLIDRPLLKFNINRFKVITVLDHIDINAPEFCTPVGRRREEKISKAFGLGNRGSVSINAQTDRGAYCPGEKIAISLFAKNDSDKDLGLIKACLMQQTVFVAGNDQRTTERELRWLNGRTPLLKKTERTWKDCLLGIDAVPPTTQERASHIIKVSYFLRITVGLSILQGGDITLYIPITIGTVPQGFHQASTAASVSGPTEVNLSTLITYTLCNKGFEYFTKSSSDFPEFEYQPWCAYVQNFKFKAKPSPPTLSQRQPTQFMPHANSSVESPVTHMQQLSLESGVEAAEMLVPTTTATATAHPTPSAPPLSAIKQAYEPGHGKVNPGQKSAFVVVRIKDSYCDEFRLKLKENRNLLTNNGGIIIAFATNVVVIKGQWPLTTSMAILLFDTDVGGQFWFEEMRKICRQSGLEILDAIIGATKGSYQNGKNVYHLTLTKKVDSANFFSREWKRYLSLAGTQLISLRKQKGGARITDVKQRRINWPDSSTTLTLTQWDTETQIYDYENIVENDVNFKELRELRELFFTVDASVVFQTEDLSFMVGSNSDSGKG